MADEHKKDETPATTKGEADPQAADVLSDLVGDEADDSAPQDHDAGEEAESDLSPREAELLAEIERLEDSQNRAMRAAAEYDNAAKRAQRDFQDARKFGAANLARDLLSVVDNLHRALAAVPEEASQENEQLGKLTEGVSMIERDLAATLGKHNIEVLNPLDQAFDPHLHEAMFETPVPGKAAGTIIQVMEFGYTLHDRLLRPARVGVAKGGADAAPPAAGANVDTKV